MISQQAPSTALAMAPTLPLALTSRQLLAYALFGLPLSLLALPVYVQVPQLYAGTLGLSLGRVGAILLAARLLDAFADPLLGHWMDKVASMRGHAGFVLMSLLPMAAGYLALFHPPAFSDAMTLCLWFGGSLVLVYLGYSMALIAHGSWGASLTQQRGERSRLTAMREGFALAGVMVAAALPEIAGLQALTLVFLTALGVSAWLLLQYAPRVPSVPHELQGWQALFAPLMQRKFRWLLAVFAMNGIAAAIPATLFLFFATDRLLLAQYAGLFLVAYFAAAAISLPLWSKISAEVGEPKAWLFSMLLSVAVFVWASLAEAREMMPFALICLLSGLALGADLALPPALLAGVIGDAGHSSQREGAYFGLWSWATKMNLALAAGISLPLLEWLGYVPGQPSEAGLRALVIAYALLPCLLKLVAAWLLWRAPLRDV